MRALAEQTAPSAYGSTVRGAGAARAKEAVARARKAVGPARRAREDGDGDGGGGGLSGPMVHALITACADDVDTALAVWQQEVRLRSAAAAAAAAAARRRGGVGRMEIRGARWVAPRPEEEDEAAAAARRDVEAHVVRALMGVCGAARRADEALRVCVAAQAGAHHRRLHLGVFRNARREGRRLQGRRRAVAAAPARLRAIAQLEASRRGRGTRARRWARSSASASHRRGVFQALRIAVNDELGHCGARPRPAATGRTHRRDEVG